MNEELEKKILQAKEEKKKIVIVGAGVGADLMKTLEAHLSAQEIKDLVVVTSPEDLEKDKMHISPEVLESLERPKMDLTLTPLLPEPYAYDDDLFGTRAKKIGNNRKHFKRKPKAKKTHLKKKKKKKKRR